MRRLQRAASTGRPAHSAMKPGAKGHNGRPREAAVGAARAEMTFINNSIGYYSRSRKSLRN